MLKGKTAVITGGSRGIGAAIAEKLASLGAQVAILYAGNTEAAEKICKKCTDIYGVKSQAYLCNVADFIAVKETIQRIKADFGSVHILINNAGITKDGLLPMMREEDFVSVVETNLQGAFNMTRHCVGIFLRQKEGVIINVSSVAGIMGNAGQTNYAASKAGLIGFTKSVARELAPKGIRCNAVAPGFIATDMTENQEASPLLASVPLGRMGTPEEVAEGVLYLINAKYVTGEVLRIDGGIAM